MPPTTSGKLDEFMLAEYNNLAAAHFKSVETSTVFFQYYLAAVSVALTALGFAGSRPGFLEKNQWLLGLVVLLIALIGLCVMHYIIHLRCDHLLYARAVNGVRRYFFETSSLPYKLEAQFRVLPRCTTIPRYREKVFFSGVLTTFALVDSSLAGVGIWLLMDEATSILFSVQYVTLCACLAAFVSFALHGIVYWSETKYRDRTYLHSRSIGVDIDGVLNMHRTQFAGFLQKNCNKTINADAITEIPVRKTKGLFVTQDDEIAVFNDPEYWTRMPVMREASRYLAELRTSLGYRVFIFSHRPWPGKSAAGSNGMATRKKWKALIPWYKRFWCWDPIEYITERWLTESEFHYDHLYIEKGDVYSLVPSRGIGRGARWSLLHKNRFQICEEREVPIFVEDDKNKAIKLSNICSYVFLIDQPYNQSSEGELPKNVIRVESWEQLTDYVKDHL